MTTTRDTLDPKKSDSMKDTEHKESPMIDTTETAPKEEVKDANESKKDPKLSKEELLEKAKTKVRTENAEEIEEGFAYVHIPYSGADNALSVEKRTINGQDLHVLPVVNNGKEYLVEVNKQVKVPTFIKDQINDTTHRGAKAKANEPTLLQ